MVERTEYVDKFSCIESIIKKTENVLRKSPIKASLKVIDPDIIVTIEKSGNEQLTHTYRVNFNESIKRNVFLLREGLKQYFPIICLRDIEEISLSAQEAEKKLSEGYSLEEVLSMKKEKITDKRYQIEKVFVPKDQLFIEDIETGERFLYKFNKMFVTVFLKRYREREWSELQAGEEFKKYSVFLEKIYSEDEWALIKAEKKRSRASL